MTVCHRIKLTQAFFLRQTYFVKEKLFVETKLYNRHGLKALLQRTEKYEFMYKYMLIDFIFEQFYMIVIALNLALSLPCNIKNFRKL